MYPSLESLWQEEQDWKMTYLARREDAAEGSISWKLDFSPGNAVKKLEVKCESTTYEDGKVEWHLASESKTILLDDGMFPDKLFLPAVYKIQTKFDIRVYTA